MRACIILRLFHISIQSYFFDTCYFIFQHHHFYPRLMQHCTSLLPILMTFINAHTNQFFTKRATICTFLRHHHPLINYYLFENLFNSYALLSSIKLIFSFVSSVIIKITNTITIYVIFTINIAHVSDNNSNSNSDSNNNNNGKRNNDKKVIRTVIETVSGLERVKLKVKLIAIVV